MRGVSFAQEACPQASHPMYLEKACISDKKDQARV